MRIFSKLFVCAVMACSGTSFAQAQAATYPERAIKIITPTAPGTAADGVSRFVADKLSRDLKSTVLVENKTGANGIIAMDFVAKSAADGYTLLMAPSTFYINKALYAKLPYDPVLDFIPVAKTVAAYLVLVVPASSPYNSVKELIDHMRVNPNALSYASAGNGSVTHIAPALLFALAGVKGVHVPYKGGDMAVTDTMGGQVAMTFTAVATAMNHLRSGRLKALAVTGPQRSSALPDVPALAELGFNAYSVISNLGFIAPKNTPAPIITKLSAAILKIGQTPEFAEFAKANGLELELAGSAAYAGAAKAELDHWTKVVALSGAKVD